MRDLTVAVEAIWDRDVGWPTTKKGTGWSSVADAVGVTQSTMRRWRSEGFSGPAIVHLVIHTGVRGRPVLLELCRLLDMSPQQLVAMVTECDEWPVMGAWTRLMASRVLRVAPADVCTLFDATREHPRGVLPGQLGLSDD